MTAVEKKEQWVKDTTKPSDLNAILDERGARYGKFIGHAAVSQELKNVVSQHLTNREKVLAPDQQEALDMICHKMARIINGDANYIDSWRDVSGYAALVADRLEGTVR